jgi:nucleoside phosphorylase
MVLLITATPWEASAIRRRLPARTGRTRRPIRLLETGIGATAARHALAETDVPDVTLTVSCGFAGAIQPELRTGELVADVRGLETELLEALREGAAAAGLRLSFGTIGQAEKVLTAAEKGRLAADPSARLAAVDMETSAVRSWSSERAAPCLAVRSVLDESSDELPTGWPDGPGLAAAVRYVYSHAGELPRIVSAWRKSAKASDTLARGLAAFLERI